MALQDLTPQLRTRLSRVERAVGLFVGLAVMLLVVGFVYYIHHMAQRKGWFLIKVPYFTYLSSGEGLSVGAPVKLMGFDVGEITRITAEAPGMFYDVYVEFNVREPYYGYLWTEGSKARVATANLLGQRVIEVTKGTNGHATYQEEMRKGLFRTNKVVTGVWSDKDGGYLPYGENSKPYYIVAEESPALGDRVNKLADRVEAALPDILNLTNQLASVLTNAAIMMTNANQLLVTAQPTMTNLAAITGNLTDPKGSLGEWLFPTNLVPQLEQVLGAAGGTLTNVNTNLVALADSIGQTLENLANLTSNLNAQVQVNTNILTRISDAVLHADEMVQGLKRHWFLRSAFKEKAVKPPPTRRLAPRGRP
jgi:ABC-type transporter Mla subunit MlaD